jgi:hypothetical protein
MCINDVPEMLNQAKLKKRLIMFTKMLTPIILIIAVLAGSAFAVNPDKPAVLEEGHLSGYVWDAATETTIADIEVRIAGHDLKATTNEEGYFSFETLEPGEYTIVVEHDGYEEYEQVVTVGDEPVRLNVLLQRAE